MNKNIAKILFSGVVAASIVADGYFTLIKNDKNAVNTTEQLSDSNSNSTNNSGNVTTDTSLTQIANYKDGSYTGASVATEWGDVQLRVTIVDGKVQQIDALKFPDTNSHSISINDQVIPVYTAEAIKTQSSQISLISGATETYNGFTGSLQDVLNQALDS